MLAGEFERKLRKLNRNVRIFCRGNDDRPAGVFIIQNNEYTDICGCDKNYLPQHTIYNSDGSIAKGGWQRVLKILVKKGLADKKKAEKLFRVNLNYKGAIRPIPKQSYSTSPMMLG